MSFYSLFLNCLSNIFYNFTCLFFAVLGLHCCTSFSLVTARGSYSLLQHAGFSLQWLLLLMLWASVVVGCGLSSCGSWALEHRPSIWGPGLGCSMTCGIFLNQGTGNQTRVSCIGRQILYHWDTREASVVVFFLNEKSIMSTVEILNTEDD